VSDLIGIHKNIYLASALAPTPIPVPKVKISPAKPWPGEILNRAMEMIPKSTEVPHTYSCVCHSISKVYTIYLSISHGLIEMHKVKLSIFRRGSSQLGQAYLNNEKRYKNSNHIYRNYI
jgi:hypothetical protein